MTALAEPDILCEGLVRIFTAQGVEVQALQGLDLRVEHGELVALVGASGSREVDAPRHPGRSRHPHRGGGTRRRA